MFVPKLLAESTPPYRVFNSIVSRVTYVLLDDDDYFEEAIMILSDWHKEVVKLYPKNKTKWKTRYIILPKDSTRDPLSVLGNSGIRNLSRKRITVRVSDNIDLYAYALQVDNEIMKRHSNAVSQLKYVLFRRNLFLPQQKR